MPFGLLGGLLPSLGRSSSLLGLGGDQEPTRDPRLEDLDSGWSAPPSLTPLRKPKTSKAKTTEPWVPDLEPEPAPPSKPKQSTIPDVDAYLEDFRISLGLGDTDEDQQLLQQLAIEGGYMQPRKTPPKPPALTPKAEAKPLPQKTPAYTDPFAVGITSPPASRPAESLARETKSADKELAFRDWYAKVAKENHLDPNPDDPRHFYDYRGAFESGLSVADMKGHGPSQFKKPGHPQEVVGGFNTITGARVPGTKQFTEQQLIDAGYDPETARRLTAEHPLPAPAHKAGQAAIDQYLEAPLAPKREYQAVEDYLAKPPTTRTALTPQEQQDLNREYTSLVKSYQTDESQLKPQIDAFETLKKTHEAHTTAITPQLAAIETLGKTYQAAGAKIAPQIEQLNTFDTDLKQLQANIETTARNANLPALDTAQRELEAARARVNPNDPTSVAAYNAQADAFQRQLATAKPVLGAIEQMKTEYTQKLQQRQALYTALAPHLQALDAQRQQLVGLQAKAQPAVDAAKAQRAQLDQLQATLKPQFDALAARRDRINELVKRAQSGTVGTVSDAELAEADRPRTWIDHAKDKIINAWTHPFTSNDWGVLWTQGSQAVADAALGIADFGISAVLGGGTPKELVRPDRFSLAQALEHLGYSSKENQQLLQNYYSPQQKADTAAVEAAGKVYSPEDQARLNALIAQYTKDGMDKKAAKDTATEEVERSLGWKTHSDRAIGTAVAALSHPRFLGTNVVESLPLMAAGWALGAGMGAAGMGEVLAGALGEGISSAAAQSEQVRQENVGGAPLSAGQQLLMAGSGIGTAFFSYYGGRVAEKLGIPDVDTMFAAAAKDATAKKTLVNIFKAIPAAMFQEGFLEEFPQGIQEQILQNFAQNKPWHDGVAENAILGAFAGAIMGAGAQVQNAGLQQFGRFAPQPVEKSNEELLDLRQKLQLVRQSIGNAPSVDVLEARIKGIDDVLAERGVAPSRPEAPPSEPPLAPAAPEGVTAEAPAPLPDPVIAELKQMGLTDAHIDGLTPEHASVLLAGDRGVLHDDEVAANRPAREAAGEVLTQPEEAPTREHQIQPSTPQSMRHAQVLIETLRTGDRVVDSMGREWHVTQTPSRGGMLTTLNLGDPYGRQIGGAFRTAKGQWDYDPGVVAVVERGRIVRGTPPAETKVERPAGPRREVPQPVGRSTLIRAGLERAMPQETKIRRLRRPPAQRLPLGKPIYTPTPKPAARAAPVEAPPVAKEAAVPISEAPPIAPTVKVPTPPPPSRPPESIPAAPTAAVPRTTPGTRVTWRTGREWADGLRTIYARKASAETHAQIRAHVDELAKHPEWIRAQSREDLEAIKQVFARVGTKGAADVPSLVPPRGQRAGTSYERIITEVNNALQKAKGREPAVAERKPFKVGDSIIYAGDQSGSVKAVLPDGQVRINVTSPKGRVTITVAPEKIAHDPLTDAEWEEMDRLARKEDVDPDSLTDDESERLAELQTRVSDAMSGTEEAEPPHGPKVRDVDVRAEAMPEAQVFPPPAPDEVVKLPNLDHKAEWDKRQAEGYYITPEQAAAQLEAWKAEAKRLGQVEDNSKKVIYSLFDRTGNWSQPFVDAGYLVRRYDRFRGHDLQEFFPIGDIIADKEAGYEIVGVLAAPPCPSFASSGARWWSTKHDQENQEHLEKLYGYRASRYFDTPLEYATTLVELTRSFISFAAPTRFHVLENPVGRINTSLDLLPKPLLTFHPAHFGDPYAKKTQLWGSFDPNLPTAPVYPTKGSYISDSLRGTDAAEKLERSETPEGFSYAFFMANNGVAQPAAEPVVPTAAEPATPPEAPTPPLSIDDAARLLLAELEGTTAIPPATPDERLASGLTSAQVDELKAGPVAALVNEIDPKGELPFREVRAELEQRLGRALTPEEQIYFGLDEPARFEDTFTPMGRRQVEPGVHEVTWKGTHEGVEVTLKTRPRPLDTGDGDFIDAQIVDGDLTRAQADAIQASMQEAEDEGGDQRPVRVRLKGEPAPSRPAVSQPTTAAPEPTTKAGVRFTLEQGPFRAKVTFNGSEKNPIYRAVVTRDGARVSEYETVDFDDAESSLTRQLAAAVTAHNTSPRVTVDPKAHAAIKGYLQALGYENVTQHNDGSITVKVTANNKRLVFRATPTKTGELVPRPHNKTQAKTSAFRQFKQDLAQHKLGRPVTAIGDRIIDSRTKPTAAEVPEPQPGAQETNPVDELPVSDKEPWQMTWQEFRGDRRAYVIPKRLQYLATPVEMLAKGKGLEGLTLVQLQHVAESKGIPTSGTKEKLTARIVEAMKVRLFLAGQTRGSLAKFPKSELGRMLRLVVRKGLSLYTSRDMRAGRLLQWRNQAERTGLDAIATANHHAAVRRALRQGQTVPAEVLARYPHLVKEFNLGRESTGGTPPTVPTGVSEGPDSGDAGAGSAGSGQAQGAGAGTPTTRTDPISVWTERFFTDTVLPAARAQGFSGTDDELRAAYEDEYGPVGVARRLLDDAEMRGVGEESDSALIRDLIAIGGITPWTMQRLPGQPAQKLRGEFESIVQGLKAQGYFGVRGPFREDGWSPEDEALDRLHAENKWLGMKDWNDLIRRLETMAVNGVDTGVKADDIEWAMAGALGDPKHPWWIKDDPSVITFRSGNQAAKTDIDGYIRAGKPVGIVAHANPAVRAQAVQYAQQGGPVFVDSGAFGNTTVEDGVGRSTLNFDRVLDYYEALIRDVAGDNPLLAGNLWMVAPDVAPALVNGEMRTFPEETRALQRQYRDRINRLIEAGANVIVPVQVQEDRFVNDLLDTVDDFPDAQVGLPGNKGAVPTDLLAAALHELSGTHLADQFKGVHFLGVGDIGRAAEKLKNLVDVVRADFPDALITSDATRTTAMVGAGRVLTQRTQDMLRLIAGDEADEEVVDYNLDHGVAGQFFHGHWGAFTPDELQRVFGAAGLTAEQAEQLRQDGHIDQIFDWKGYSQWMRDAIESKSPEEPIPPPGFEGTDTSAYPPVITALMDIVSDRARAKPAVQLQARRDAIAAIEHETSTAQEKARGRAMRELNDSLAAPPDSPIADVLGTGEEQPRLPGDVGEVRETETATPTFEAPFSLTPEIAKPGKPGEPELFQEPEPDNAWDEALGMLIPVENRDVLYQPDEPAVPPLDQIKAIFAAIDSYPPSVPFEAVVADFAARVGPGFDRLHKAFEGAWRIRRGETKSVKDALETKKPPKPPPPPPEPPKIPDAVAKLADEPVKFGRQAHVIIKDLFTTNRGYLDWLMGLANPSPRFAAIQDYYRKYRPDYSEYVQGKSGQAGEDRPPMDPAAVLTPEVIAHFRSNGMRVEPWPNSDRVLIAGKTYDQKDTIRAAGGERAPARDDGRFRGWLLPANRVAELLGRLPNRSGDGERPGLRRASYTSNPELADLRRRADGWPDTSTLPSDRSAILSPRTEAVIRDGGRKIGVPAFVTDEQIEDVARISHAYHQGRPAYILASAPGSGKTFVAGGAMREIIRQGAKKVIFVTLNNDLIAQAKKNLADYGLEDVQFITYHQLTKKNPIDSDAIVFDEAQRIKRIEEGGAQVAVAAQQWIGRTKFTVFSSATPVENPVELAYISTTGLFKDPFGEFWKFAAAFGATPKKSKDANDNDVYDVVWRRTQTSDDDAAAGRQWLHKMGVFTSRPIRLPAGQVDSRNVKITVSPEHERRYDLFTQAARANPGGVTARMWVKNFQKRLLEAAKIDQGIVEARSALDRGRFPIVFVETKAERKIDIPDLMEREAEWQRAAAMARAMREQAPRRKEYGLPPRGVTEILADYMGRSGESVIEIRPAVEVIQKAFGADKVAVYTGPPVTGARATQNLEEWRSGQRPVLVATMAKGGTGLSLHDTVGNHQTTQININMPWKATGVVQVAQRSARYGLKGRAEIQWLFADNIPFDRALAHRVGGRMADLGAIVHGAALAGSREIEEWDFDNRSFHDDALTADQVGLPWSATNIAQTFNLPQDRAEALVELARHMGVDLATLPGIRLMRGGAPGPRALEQLTVERVRNRFRRAPLVSVNDAALALGGQLPNYLSAVGDFLREQKEKVVSGRLSPRDVAKAYLMTLGSIGAQPINLDTFIAKTGMRPTPDFVTTENGVQKVRPEEAVAYWMFTREGQRALDAAEAGRVTPKDFATLLRMRDAYGRNDIRNNGFRRSTTGMRSLFDIKAITDALNETKGDSAKMGDVLRTVSGIGHGKEGFIKFLLGIGDTPTVDTIALNYWLTGKGDIRDVTGKPAQLARDVKDVLLPKPGPRAEVTARVQDRVAHVARQLGLDPETGPHLVHHWLWDKARGTETTHTGLMKAMALAQQQQPFDFGPTAQTETPAFKRWFKDSMAVDAADQPLVVYHATPSSFSVFKPGGKDVRISGPAIWFTSNREVYPAAHQVEGYGGKYKVGTNVMPVYLSAQAPLRVTTQGNAKEIRQRFATGSQFPFAFNAETVAAIKKAGYDSVFVWLGDEATGVPDELIVFEPTQIKSAIGNRGTFSPTSPNILLQGDEPKVDPALLEKIKQLQVRLDLYYKTGAKQSLIDRLETQLEDLQDHAENLAEALREYDRDNEDEVGAVSVEQDFAHIYHTFIAEPVSYRKGEPIEQRRKDAADALRSALTDAAWVGTNQANRPLPGLSDDTLIEAAKDAYDHQLELRGRLRRGRTTNAAMRLFLQTHAANAERLYQEPELPPVRTRTPTTPAFKRWFKDSKVVDRDGKPLVVYHGTTGVFDVFDSARASEEADMGAGFYFTDSPGDAGANYAGEGPDLTGKLEGRVERLAAEYDWDTGVKARIDQRAQEMDLPAPEDRDRVIRTLAKEDLAVEHGGLSMPVYLSLQNPAILGRGPDRTMLEFDEETETGTLVEFIQALRDAAADFSDGKVEPAIAKIWEEALDGGISVSLDTAIDLLRRDDWFGYYQNDQGELASHEVIRRALEQMGFDGVIDRGVPEKFGPGRRPVDPFRTGMAGVYADTVHYVAFRPEQIKSAIGNRGTFDPAQLSILYQEPRVRAPKASVEFLATGEALIRALTNPDVSSGVHELAHVARRWLFDLTIPAEQRAGISDEDIRTAAKWAGARISKDGVIEWKWAKLDDQGKPVRDEDGNIIYNVSAEEKFARGFERYLYDGQAPTPQLQNLFDKFASWLRDIYATLMGSSLDIQISPEMRQVYDRLVIRMGPPPRGAAPSPAKGPSTTTQGPTTKARPPTRPRLFQADPTPGEVFFQDPEDPPATGTSGYTSTADEDDTPLVASVDPEVEAALRKAKGQKKESFLDKAREKLSNLPKLARHYQEISPSRSPLEATAHELLLEQERARRWGQLKAYNEISRIIDEPLTVREVDVFARALILPDLLKDIENGLYDGKDLPFKYKNVETIQTDLQNVQKVVAQHPAIYHALQDRAAFVDKLTRELVAAKLLKPEVLENPAYYHRKVMEFAGQDYGLGGGGGEVRPRTRGFQRARTGGSDFNTAYHESEFEWVSEALAELKTKQTLDALKGAADITSNLKAEARAKNLERFGHELAIKNGVKPDDPNFVMYARKYRKEALSPYAQAMRVAARSVIESFAEEGGVIVPKGWENVIAELRQQYGQWKTDNQGIPRAKWKPFNASHPQLLGLLRALATQDTPAGKGARRFFRVLNERREFIKKTLGVTETSSGKYIDPLNVHALLKLAPKPPEGRAHEHKTYVTWQPKEGNNFFRATAIDERVADAVIAQVRQLTEKDKRDILAVGGPKETWIIPQWLAETLDNFQNDVPRPKGVLGDVDDAAQTVASIWKQSVLYTPTRAIKYNLNNVTGDADAVAAYSPGIFTHVGDSSSFLWRTTYHTEALTPRDAARLERLTELGVIDAGLTATEIPGVNNLPAFQRLAEEDPVSFMARMAGYVGKYFGTVEQLSKYRENILRLASYEYMLKHVQAGHVIYAASNPGRVDALRADVAKATAAKNETATRTAQERLAALLARDLAGDYQAVSVATGAIRKRIPTFISFQEVNLKRYYRLLMNARREEGSLAGRAGVRIAGALGRGAVRTAVKTVSTLGLQFALVNAFLIAVNLWNRLIHPDELEELRDESRQTMHFILGRLPDGSIWTVRAEGAFSSLLSWADLQNWGNDALDLVTGDLDVADKLTDIAQAIPNKAVQQVGPFGKLFFELMLGRKSYPNIFRPTPIRDYGEHIASVFALDWLYQDITGLPTPPYKWATRFLFYRTDPGEAAYFDIRSRASRFLSERKTERPSAGDPTAKGNALYYYKRAAGWGDDAAAEKWLDRYFELGGTLDGMEQSIKMSAPLGALNADEQREFLGSLSDKEQRILDLADDWYADAYGGESIQLRRKRQ